MPWVFAVFCIVPGQYLSAACIPLPSTRYAALDRATDERPERAVADVQRLLSDPKISTDPERVAELHAIGAEAQVQAGGPDQVRAHVDAGLQALDAVAAGATRDTLMVRLRSTRAIQLALTGDSAEALQILDPILLEARSVTIERSCLLAARSLVHLQSRSLGDAAADALESYETAKALRAAYARMNAAYHLAGIYSRAGLNAEAERMVDEVVVYGDREHLLQLQVIAAFLQARVLNGGQKFSEALEAAQRSRKLALQLGSPASVAAATVAVCIALVEVGELKEAQLRCEEIDAALRATQRRDLIGEAAAQRARILLARGRATEALGLLDGVLREGATPVGPSYVARYLRYRVAVKETLGQWRAALEDLRRAESLERQVTALDRVNAVAVISATNERIRWIAGQRELTARIDGQRREIASQRRLRNISVAFAGTASVFLIALALVLRQTLRQRRALRNEEATLRTVVEHTPDALLLLDRDRRVRYANRSVTLGEPPPPPGALPWEGISGSPVGTLRTVINEAYERRVASTALTLIESAGGSERYLEMQAAPVIEGTRLLGAVIRSSDVSATHRLEREVVGASNLERRQMSSDLHEGLSQQLAGVNYVAKSLVTGLDRGSPPSREALELIAEQLTSAVVSLRQLARDLSPIAVERGFLGDALRRLASEFDGKNGITVDMRGIEATIAVNAEAADHLFRIAREAIRHATMSIGVKRVTVALGRQGSGLVLAVSDDGRGVLSDDAMGFGRRLIEYRARLLGGSVNVRTGDGGSTCVTVVAPWSRVGEEAPPER